MIAFHLRKAHYLNLHHPQLIHHSTYHRSARIISQKTFQLFHHLYRIPAAYIPRPYIYINKHTNVFVYTSARLRLSLSLRAYGGRALNPRAICLYQGAHKYGSSRFSGCLRESVRSFAPPRPVHARAWC